MSDEGRPHRGNRIICGVALLTGLLVLSIGPVAAQGGATCDQTFPNCDGTCPNAGEVCLHEPVAEVCFCQQVGPTCGQSQYPTCDGACGPDETCVPEVTTGECRCEPPGEACSQCGPGAHFIDACGPFPPVGTDLVADNGAVVGIDMDGDCIRDINLVLSPCPAPHQLLHIDKTLGPIDDSANFPGTSPVDGHPTGPGFDVIDTEIVSLCLTDGIVTLVAGAGGASALPLQQSLGTVAEDLATPDPSSADSTFDVFFEISGVPGGPLYNQIPLSVRGRINCLPPAANYAHPTGICLPLTTEGLCDQGPNEGNPCINDLDCPGGSCVGTVVVANLVSANHSVNQDVCNLSPAPECLGDCPPGQVCLPDELGGDSCACVPVLCEQGPFPDCNGECPVNSHCEAVGTTNPVLPTPDLPPEPDPPECDRIVSMYAGQDLHALFPNGIDFSDPQHKCFQNVQRQDDGNGNEIETFDSIVEATIDDGSGPQLVSLSGPVTIVTFGKTGNTTGTFETEIVSMSLTGNVSGLPVEVRESPSLPSQGQTTIVDLGGGLWQIDSFFDVFTELSVAGGPFEPQVNGPGRVRLVPVDPGSCECVSDQAPCELSDPATCDGPCPNTSEVCTVDSSGGPCFCAPPPVECELSDPATCDGFCPDPNDVCTPQTNPILPSPELPPESQTPGTPDCDQILSQYEGQGVHALFPGGVDFSDPQHKCFLNVNRQDDGSGNEIETFDSTVEGQVDLGGGPVPVTLSGPVTIVSYGKTGNTTGTFQTEMVSMSLTGDVGGIPIEIRESPSSASTGQTTITDLGGGQWEIDSFFDVFTELSVNGGPFEPQTNGPGRMTLVPTTPNPCECLPAACDLSDPLTCDGPCPNEGEICTIDPAGGPCFCERPPTPCELSDPATCGGDCPIAGDLCTVSPDGTQCFCEPPPVLCEDTFPACDGDCPIDTHCEPGTSGSVVLPSPDLPPESDPPDPECVQILSQYEGQDVHALFPGGIDFSDPLHKCFQNVNRSDDGSGNEIETFDSTVEGQVDMGGGPMPVTLSGPVAIVTYGKTGNTAGTFATEIVSMSLTGDVGGIPIEIRESPSLASPGQTTITDLGGGLWQIDSFFDVFTELSVSGGPFQPQTNGPGRMVLRPTQPDSCECVPDVVPCELSDPATCDGPCPNTSEVCTVDSSGGPCFCAPPPVECELSDPATCDGFCPDPNDVCTPQTNPILPSPELPPESQTPGTPDCDQILSQYEGQGVHALFPGGVDFSDPQHKCFLNVNRQDDGSGNEIETFDSTVDGQVDLGGGPVPVTLSGPVTIVSYGKTGNTTGTFQTEMVSMSLTGDVGGIPIEIRESPSSASTGQTTITDLGGGQWEIDSFFDVFTELSVNGGPFEPQTNGPGRMTLVPTTPNPCECLPAACDLSDPMTCDGPCPNEGEICTIDPAGGPCFCERPPTPCELSDPATCGGDCPIAGDLCTVSPDGTQCFCEPPPVLCEDTFPACDGDCPIDTHCEPGTSGSVVLPSPDLPPESDPPDPECVQILSQYEGQDVHALFPGGIDFSDPLHKCFQNVNRSDDGSGNEIETFDSTVEGQVDMGGGPMPVTLSGPVAIVSYGKTGNTTGTFATEIVSMSLTGDVGGIPIEIRESPSLASPGQTTITDLGGGLWQIDSFFDVFTELSVSGGPFQPQTNGPGRMVLRPTQPDSCECVPDVVPCELSDPLTCDGFCPDPNDVCTPDPAGGPCACRPLEPPFCEDTVAPVCDGSCPPNQRCASLADDCLCRPCISVVPGPVEGVEWPFKDRIRWLGSDCATLYNLYKLTAASLTDSDGDGLADSYGGCSQPDLTVTEAFEPGDPAIGQVSFYTVTGKNPNGEGSMGLNSALAERINVSPCP